MSFAVRLGGLADIEAAVEVYKSSRNASAKGRPPPEWRVEEIRANLRRDDAWFFIALDGQATVGMASAMPSREDEGSGDLIPELCYLDLIFVAPDRWGEGIGGAILDEVIADAASRGFVRIHLWTHHDSERAHALYRSRGFAQSGRERGSWTDPTVHVSEWEGSIVEQTF